MRQPNPTFRPATSDDAIVLAELVNYAGEGMPLYLWGQLAEPGEAAWDVVAAVPRARKAASLTVTQRSSSNMANMLAAS
jgi:hypothetical protein